MVDTAGSVQVPHSSNHGRVAATGSASVPSVSNGYPFPASTAVPASQTTSVSDATTLHGHSSDASASPTLTPGRREQNCSPSSRLGLQRSIPTDERIESSFDHTPRDMPLPRINPVEGLEDILFRETLPPVGPEAASRRDGDSPRTSTRRSDRAPAPLLHRDTSISSMGSNLSFATTASSTHTPGTPIDDPRPHRYTEASWTTGPSSRRHGDLDQPPRPIHPPLSSYSPSWYPPTFSSSQAMTGIMSPITNVTNDLPHDRRSLRNLSLGDSRPVRREPQPDPEAQPQDREQVQHQNPYFLPSTTRSTLEHPPALSYEQINETDPLSVLAYAGRMVDEEVHKPP